MVSDLLGYVGLGVFENDHIAGKAMENPPMFKQGNTSSFMVYFVAMLVFRDYSLLVTRLK